MRMSAGWRRKRARSICGCVAGADGDFGQAKGHAGGAGERGDGCKRRAEVAFDVDREGFEGTDVDDAATFGGIRDAGRGTSGGRGTRERR
jgi:hypothetical protein